MTNFKDYLFAGAIAIILIVFAVGFSLFIATKIETKITKDKQINVVFTDNKAVDFIAEKVVEYDYKLVVVTKSTVKRDADNKPILDKDGLPVLVPSEVVTLPLESIKGYTYLK